MIANLESRQARSKQGLFIFDFILHNNSLFRVQCMLESQLKRKQISERLFEQSLLEAAFHESNWHLCTQNVSVKSFGKFSVGKAFGRSHLGVSMPNQFLSNSCEKRRIKTYKGCFQPDYVSKYPKISFVSHCFDFDRRKTRSFSRSILLRSTAWGCLGTPLCRRR